MVKKDALLKRANIKKIMGIGIDFFSHSLYYFFGGSPDDQLLSTGRSLDFLLPESGLVPQSMVLKQLILYL